MQFHPDAHSGEDASVWGAKVIALDRGMVRIKGNVTARGGDRTDWLAIDLPASEYQRVADAVGAGRPGQKVRMTIRDHLHNAQWKVGERGRFYVEVTAPGRDEAGEYVLTAVAQPPPQPSQPTPVVVAPPPPAPTTPPAWTPPTPVPLGAYGSDAGVGIGWTGMLLDRSGNPVAGTSFTIVELTPRLSVGVIHNATIRQLTRTPDAQLRP